MKYIASNCKLFRVKEKKKKEKEDNNIRFEYTFVHVWKRNIDHVLYFVRSL